jgi:hypothetical protein
MAGEKATTPLSRTVRHASPLGPEFLFLCAARAPVMLRLGFATPERAQSGML